MKGKKTYSANKFERQLESRLHARKMHELLLVGHLQSKLAKKYVKARDLSKTPQFPFNLP